MPLLKSFLNIFPIIFFTAVSLNAQELNCNVAVNGENTSITDRSVFRDMENAFEQFLNNRQWADDDFQNLEKIKCNILITLDRESTFGNYVASVQIQSARPVYNATYESILLNFADRDWIFSYVEGQPIEFNLNNYTNSISSLLAFYAYIIIGLDYDSFGEFGGNTYFQNALTVVNNAQQSNQRGWEPMNSTRNRYWLVENINNQQMQEIRKNWYIYHRKGLDTFFETPDKSREQALGLLQAMQKTQRAYPNSILVITFLDSKSDEFINLFSDGDLTIRKKAYDLLVTMDPTKRQQYDKLIQ